mgnify:CR=1 FL=1
MYGEDIDLSYKITKAGYKNHYLGNTTVLHDKGESTKKDDAYFERFYGAMETFYRKHFNKNFQITLLTLVLQSQTWLVMPQPPAPDYLKSGDHHETIRLRARA